MADQLDPSLTVTLKGELDPSLAVTLGLSPRKSKTLEEKITFLKGRNIPEDVKQAAINRFMGKGYNETFYPKREPSAIPFQEENIGPPVLGGSEGVELAPIDPSFSLQNIAIGKGLNLGTKLLSRGLTGLAEKAGLKVLTKPLSFPFKKTLTPSIKEEPIQLKPIEEKPQKPFNKEETAKYKASKYETEQQKQVKANLKAEKLNKELKDTIKKYISTKKLIDTPVTPKERAMLLEQARKTNFLSAVRDVTGGKMIKATPGLAEEYKGIPIAFKSSKGIPGDEVASMMGLGENEMIEQARIHKSPYQVVKEHIDGLREEYLREHGEELDALERKKNSLEEELYQHKKAGAELGKINPNPAYKTSLFSIEGQAVIDSTRPFTETEAAIQRRGILPDRAVDARAAELVKTGKITKDTVLGYGPGTALNAEEGRATQIIVDRSAHTFYDLAEKELKNPSPEGKLALENHLFETVLLDTKLQGVASEWGRTGRIFQRKINLGRGGDISFLEEGFVPDEKVKTFISDTLKDRNIYNIAKDMMRGGKRNIGNSIRELTRRMRPPKPITFGDKIAEWAQGTLIGPVTIPVHFMGRVWGLGSKITQGALQGSGWSEVVGAAQGLKDGAILAIKSLTDENFISPHSIIRELGGRKAIGGITGKLVRTSFRVLAATDAAFEEVMRRSELYSQAVLEAGKERVPNFDARVEELVKNPTEDMIAVIERKVKHYMYQEDFGEFGSWIEAGRRKAGWLGRTTFPFYKTPMNILKTFIQESPLGLAKTFSGDIPLAERRARVAFGSLLTMGIFTSLKTGNLELTGGGPKNKKLRDLLVAQGWQSYSFRIHAGGYHSAYHSFTKLGVLSHYLSVIADATEEKGEGGDLPYDQVKTHLWNGVKSLGQEITNPSYMTNLRNIISAMNGDQSAWKTLGVAVSEFIPTVIKETRRELDKTQRTPGSFTEYLENQLPGLSRNVPAKIDIKGEPIQYEGIPTSSYWNPLYYRSARPDETLQNEFNARIQLHRARETAKEKFRMSPAYQSMNDRERIQTLRTIDYYFNRVR